MALRPTPQALLIKLLVGIFKDAADMKRFSRTLKGSESLVDELPGENVSAIEMADALALTLEKSGPISHPLFEELNRIRPLKSDEILAVSRAWSRSGARKVRIKSARNIFLVLASVLSIGLGVAPCLDMQVLNVSSPSTLPGSAENLKPPNAVGVIRNQVDVAIAECLPEFYDSDDFLGVVLTIAVEIENGMAKSISIESPTHDDLDPECLIDKIRSCKFITHEGKEIRSTVKYVMDRQMSD